MSVNKIGTNYDSANLQDGRFTMGSTIYARCLPEAWHRACLQCWREGIRVETPKHQPGVILGYDMAMPIMVTHPMEEPRIHKYGITDDEFGLESYRLEVAFGIHDHWVGEEVDDTRWQYTYHGRFEQTNQINRAIQVAKEDYLAKKRFGRNYELNTWDPAHDLECPDPPCLQWVQWRIVRDFTQPKLWRLNVVTTWRSRDLFKAWLMNAYAFTYWQKIWASQLSCEINKDLDEKSRIDIQVGSYIDFASSNHLYGLYFKDGGIENLLKQMDAKSWKEFAWETNHFLPTEDLPRIRSTIAAQLEYEKYSLEHYNRDQKKASVDMMQDDEGFGCKDVMKFPYPKSWDE